MSLFGCRSRVRRTPGAPTKNSGGRYISPRPDVLGGFRPPASGRNAHHVAGAPRSVVRDNATGHRCAGEDHSRGRFRRVPNLLSADHGGRILKVSPARGSGGSSSVMLSPCRGRRRRDRDRAPGRRRRSVPGTAGRRCDSQARHSRRRRRVRRRGRAGRRGARRSFATRSKGSVREGRGQSLGASNR